MAREYTYSDGTHTYLIGAVVSYDTPEPRWGYPGGWDVEECWLVDVIDETGATAEGESMDADTMESIVLQQCREQDRNGDWL